MEMRDCPLCGSKPLLLSPSEVVCVNGLCPARGVITDRKVWNRRAEVVNRDSQILKELKLEYAIRNNEEQFRSGKTDFTG